MSERAGRVPRLNLLAEEDLDLVGVGLLDEGKDFVVDCREHLRREGAHIIEVELNCMQSWS